MFDMTQFANNLLHHMAAAQTAPKIKREPCPHCHGCGVTRAHVPNTERDIESCAWCAGNGYVLTESIEVTP